MTPLRVAHRRWALAILAIAIAGTLVWPRPGGAHPMGNFSISHYAEIRADADALQLRYLIDMAEIPTFQEVQEHGIVAEVGHPSLDRYVLHKIEVLTRGLTVETNGRRLALQRVSTDVSVSPGAGGLPTLKLGALYRIPLDRASSVHDVRYQDENFPDRVGWKEIVAREGRGVTLVSTTAPAVDRSGGLSEYPTDPLSTPPQDLQARVVFARQIETAEPAPPPSRGPDDRGGQAFRSARAGEREEPPRPSPVRERTVGTPRSAFTELMTTTGPLSLGVVLIALGIAAGLGAFHALEPGHGKTLVAAYLVGSRGTAAHAALLGLVVTLTHTAAVYLLGGVTLYASRFVVPERLYPWLGLASGLAVIGVGVSLFIGRCRRRAAHHHHDHHDHTHADHEPHEHHHHDHAHDHDHHHGHHHHGHHHHHPEGPLSMPALLTLGVTGGIVPCPGALVVLLSAIALGRVGFGLLLIVAFSAGLAAVLIGIGLLMVSARRFVSRWQGESALITRWLPVASSAVITLAGVGLTVQALATMGIS